MQGAATEEQGGEVNGIYDDGYDTKGEGEEEDDAGNEEPVAIPTARRRGDKVDVSSRSGENNDYNSVKKLDRQQQQKKPLEGAQIDRGVLNSRRPEADLNELVSDSVTLALSHFGSTNVVESILYILELEHSVDLQKIADDLEPFRAGIKSMFGTAAYVIEERVCAEIAKRLGIDPEGKKIGELIARARDALSSTPVQRAVGTQAVVKTHG